MIDIKELRLLVQDFKLAGSPMFVQTTQMNELLDRLEAAEKERDAESIAMYRKARDERDALRAKVEQMEKQAPVGWLLDGDFYEVRQMSLYKDNEPLPGQTALYALPGAQSAQSIPDDVMRDAKRYRLIVDAATRTSSLKAKP